MSNKQTKPIYYDGSGTIRVEKIADLHTTVITPKYQDIPLIKNVEQKPIYYDGSGKINT